MGHDLSGVQKQTGVTIEYDNRLYTMGRKARHGIKSGNGKMDKRRFQSNKSFSGDLVFHDNPSDQGSSEDSSDAQNSSEEEELSEEEILPLNVQMDDDEDDEDDDEDVEKEVEKINQMGNQWGKSRKNFYDADMIDEDDENAEKEEEEAALELQKKQLEELDEDDLMEEDSEDSENELENDQPQMGDDNQLDLDLNFNDDEVVEKVEKNISSLTKQQKLQVLTRTAPELLGLVDELKTHLHFLDTVLRSVSVKLSSEVNQVHGPFTESGVEFLQSAFQLYSMYCANISFYLALKANTASSTRDHPIVQQLLYLKSLMDDVLPVLNTRKWKGKLSQFLRMDCQAEATLKSTNKTAGEKTNVAPGPGHHEPEEEMVTVVDQDADAFYNLVAQKTQAEKQKKKDFYTPLPMATAELESTDPTLKRGASYQIIKNRGLTAHKNKLNRNPRVKKRVQYRKAVIRRKGQVRDVRTGEMGAYGGEGTGIKSNLSRSRKIRN